MVRVLRHTPVWHYGNQLRSHNQVTMDDDTALDPLLEV